MLDGKAIDLELARDLGITCSRERLGPFRCLLRDAATGK